MYIKMLKKESGMSQFNCMTLTAACSLITDGLTHAELSLLDVEWNLDGRTLTSPKAAISVALVSLATKENIFVYTPRGRISLERAIVEKTFHIPRLQKKENDWQKFFAGLRFDGFEIEESYAEDDYSCRNPIYSLRRMLPKEIPDLDFREAESEIEHILTQYNFETSSGHLRQAISNFEQGYWSTANGAFRTFFESFLSEIASQLGYTDAKEANAERNYLGNLDPPFLLDELNEWHKNLQKPQYLSGVWSRLHPQGSHPGLSEEDDCAFRVQIILITARLLLRRFVKRVS
jgi:hypothetical protein